MLGKVENGNKAAIETATFNGDAPIERLPGGIVRVAFTPAPATGNPAAEHTFKVDGERYSFVKQEYGKFNSAARIVTLKEISK